jgi:hypothetical protein
MAKPKPRRKPKPIDVAQLGATIAVGQAVKQLGEDTMAQFETLNTAIDSLSESVDSLVSRLESATVEDPAVQAAIDEAVARINEVQARIDGLHPGSGTAPSGSEPHPDQTLPGDLPQS